MRHIFWRASVFFISLSLLSGCKEKQSALFTELPSSITHVDFVNQLEETEQHNISTYEYFYNGGGVASGDLNNDGLNDLFFTGNMVANRLYINQGNFQFNDVTQRAGLTEKNVWSTGVTMADVNGDGWLDIYVCHSGPDRDGTRSNTLYINNGDGIPSFTERAAEYGLDAEGTFSTQASFFDYDRDGDLDMFLLNHAKIYYSPFFNTTKLRTKRHPLYGNRLYQNNNGKFVDVSEQEGISGSALNFGLGVSVSDVNNDGWPDIYVTNDYEEQDFFYLNEHDSLNNHLSFRECIKETFRHLARNAMGSDIADFNNDGLCDVIVMDMLPEDNQRQKLLKGPDEFDKYKLSIDSGYHHQYMRNMLQLNTGPGPGSVPVFSEIGQLAGISKTDWSWNPAFADFDNDGWKDILITNGYLRDFTNMDYVKYGYQVKATNPQQKNKALYEIIKKMPSTKLNNYLFRNQGNLLFQNMTGAWGLNHPSITNGAVYSDLDNDGDLDIVMNNLNENALIYRNNAESITKHHFLKIKLKGNDRNTFAMGSKVEVRLDSGITIMQELYTTRGFQSAVPPEMVFGLGRNTRVKSIKILWADGRVTELKDVTKVDTIVSVAQEGSVMPVNKILNSNGFLFTDHTASSRVTFRHRENAFIDYKVQFLLPYQLSRFGPCLAKADVNNDGNEDFYVGGPYKQPGQLFLMNDDGHFRLSESQPWNVDSLREDTGAIFFDPDRDGDMDLYVVSGGTEYPPEYGHLMQDRIYVNDGKGNFSRCIDCLPEEHNSGSCVAAGDVDRDGDVDLFVPSRVVPGKYPLAPHHLLLQNTSKAGAIRFDQVTTSSGLDTAGMISSAVWIDYDADGWSDLMTAGEFTPVRLFKNEKGKLREVTVSAGLNATNGLWCKLAVADFDADGDLDIVAGNAGSNLPFQVSKDRPLTLIYGDFNNDGKVDPLLFSYTQGISYPYPSRDELLEQLPALKRKFVTYDQYSKARIQDILTTEQLAMSHTLKAYELNSCYLENLGNGTFSVTKLPMEAQFSMAFGLLPGDFDGDNKVDILLSGNFYPYRVQLGQSDACNGLFLKGDGHGHFKPYGHAQTGFYTPGDVRSLVAVASRKGNRFVIVGKNNDSIELLKLTSLKKLP